MGSFSIAADFMSQINHEASLRFLCALSDNKETCFVTSTVVVKQSFHKISLSQGALSILNEPNAGGSSERSEAMSFEFVKREFGARLEKTEMAIAYDWDISKKTDYSICIFNQRVGVSVTRAMKYQGRHWENAFRLHVSKRLRRRSRMQRRLRRRTGGEATVGTLRSSACGEKEGHATHKRKRQLSSASTNSDTSTTTTGSSSNNSHSNSNSDSDDSKRGRRAKNSGRLWDFPVQHVFSLADAFALLRKKLYGIRMSTRDVLDHDRWTKQVLHVWVRQPYIVDLLAVAYDALKTHEPELVGNSIVLVTLSLEADWISE